VLERSKKTCMDWQVARVSIAGARGVSDLRLLARCAIQRVIQLPVVGEEICVARIIRSKVAACQSAACSRGMEVQV
jgi:hypothetical protein